MILELLGSFSHLPMCQYITQGLARILVQKAAHVLHCQYPNLILDLSNNH